MQNLNTFEKATLATVGMTSAIALMAGAAHAQAFDGFYMGVSASSLSGLVPFGDNYTSDDGGYELGGATVGAFVGMNKHIGTGNMVLGAELAFQGYASSTAVDGDTDHDPYGIISAIDLKGRVGTVLQFGASPILLYGFGGFSFVNATAGSHNDYSSPGINYGVGAEMALGENFSVGLELLGRTVSAYDDYDEPRVSMSHQQISLRAAFRF